MKIKLMIVVFTSLLILTGNAWSAPVRVERVEAELVSETKSIKPGAPFWVALRLRMDDGWHTYWRNPGDSGLETQVTWNLPKGFNASELEWPYPERLEVAGLITFGYEGEVFLLSKIDLPGTLQIGSDVTLSANTIWLSCADVCIPGQAQLDLKLPVSDDLPKLDERWAHDFAKARANLPQTSNSWNIKAQRKGKKIILSVTAGTSNKTLPQIQFFPYEEGLFNLLQNPKISKIKNGFKIELPILKSYSKPISDINGILFSKNGWGGTEGKAVEVRSKIVK